ncbi:vitamin-D-receptor interacting mediator subunit 4-domain-containing protein [Gongronella butleri]|nr:vitamin-D-receptor interacting mediator subunit 4-domain-containing protein [Gongronella butleri]
MSSSLRDQVDQLLTQYSQATQKYFQSMLTVAQTNHVDPHNNPEANMQAIIKIDKQLQQAIDQIGEHQARQRQIIQVQDEIQTYQETLLSMVGKLNSARQDLDVILDKAKGELKATEYASSANVQFTDVLSYASKLSKYTSAPPNFDLMNREIKADFEKPYPDEERMRRGMLYWQYATQPIPEDKFESSDNDESMSEEGDSKRDEPAANVQAEAAPVWILDLNPTAS